MELLNEKGSQVILTAEAPLRVLVGIDLDQDFNYLPKWNIPDAFGFYGANYMLLCIVYHIQTEGQGHFTIEVRIDEGAYYYHDGLQGGVLSFRHDGWTYLDTARDPGFDIAEHEIPAVAGMLYVRV